MYFVTNVKHTPFPMSSPNFRARTVHFGLKAVGKGKHVELTDVEYERYKAQIDNLVKNGIITVQKLHSSPEITEPKEDEANNADSIEELEAEESSTVPEGSSKPAVKKQASGKKKTKKT